MTEYELRKMKFHILRAYEWLDSISKQSKNDNHNLKAIAYCALQDKRYKDGLNRIYPYFDINHQDMVHKVEQVKRYLQPYYDEKAYNPD